MVRVRYPTTTVLFLCLLTQTFGFLNLCHNKILNSHSSGSSYRSIAADYSLQAASKDCPAAIAGDPPESTVTKNQLLKQVNLLVDLWKEVAFPDTVNEDSEVEFKLSDYSLTRVEVAGLLKHFQACKDCAGDAAFLMAGASDDDGSDALKLLNVEFQLLTHESNDDRWGLFDRSLLGEDSDQPQRSIFPIESDDEVILRDSKKWVEKMIADFAICPFTTDPNRAGIPMGGVRYSISRCTSPDEAFLRYWEEVQLLLKTPERTMSTVLLIFPELGLFGNYELFEAYCESLQDALTKSALGLESQVQLVFFHPKFQFRDGQARTTDESAAPNFARRAPWPMVNILRTPQVRAAQKGVPTGVVYQQNEKHLNAVGTTTLERMLYDRNWEGLPVHSTSVKSTRKSSEEAKEVNLLDPVLTSLSGDKDSPVRCPMRPQPVKTPPSEEQSVPISAQQVSCSASVEEEEDDDDGDDDFLKLAEDVDEWLAQGGV